MSPESRAVTSLGQAVKESWARFRDVYEPLRPELYRYCRHLTRSPWDAEDMSQDAMARAYVTLGGMTEAPANPRAWLFRVASNLWLNRTRQAREVLSDGRGTESEPLAPGVERRAAREAAGTLLAQLSPQERAAIVLKDVFELSLEEVAESLSTSVGAVKAALHRAWRASNERRTSDLRGWHEHRVRKERRWAGRHSRGWSILRSRRARFGHALGRAPRASFYGICL